MPIDFEHFDRRKYPVVNAVTGYAEWAATYDDVVHDEMDVRLLERIRSVAWNDVSRALDLACGTGRIGMWLSARGVVRIDGIDITRAMLDRAAQRGVYESLTLGDCRNIDFESGLYDLLTMSLADEHLNDLRPLYAEAQRLLRANGIFVNISYHPQFLMTVGMPTHFHRSGDRDEEAVAIETHLHLMSDHVRAARTNGFQLIEMCESLIDAEYVQAKPKWERYLHTPISMACVWQLTD